MKSRSKKMMKLLGGGFLMVMAYLPLLNLFGNGTAISNEDKILSIREAIFNDKELYQSKLTDALKVACLGEERPASLIDQYNTELLVAQRAAEEATYIASTVGDVKKAENKISTPVRSKVLKSGPLKGVKIVKGTIASNLYVDAQKLSIPVRVIDKVIKNLSSKIDFRRSLRKGDQFEIAFDGNKDLVYSKIKTRRKSAAVYKFGKEGYFFENGDKVSGARQGNGSFGQPIRGKMKVTSHFGVRVHPVTRRSKKHTGVDLAVKHGTPIYAIYDGVVTRASKYAGYGKCVDIKHANGYASRYAHLSKFVVRPGSRVKKGQLIAFSGATGIATGPHLHLELARNNVAINPLRVKMMPEKPQRVSNNRKFTAFKNYFKKEVSSI